MNLASRLEAATKQYSVPMLLGRDFVDCLSPGVRAKVRQTRMTHTLDHWALTASMTYSGRDCLDA